MGLGTIPHSYLGTTEESKEAPFEIFSIQLSFSEEATFSQAQKVKNCMFSLICGL
jgi:hypothetical protein